MTQERMEPTGEDTGAEQEDESVDALRAQLSEERARADGYHKSWQRAAADFQNYKRRAEEERQAGMLYANKALVLNLLPVYDDLNRALENADAGGAGQSWIEGIRQIAKKFAGALEVSGVKEIPAEGADFDPNLHEAIAEGAGPAGKVVQVVQKGYTMGERPIRHAMVIVGNGQ